MRWIIGFFWFAFLFVCSVGSTSAQDASLSNKRQRSVVIIDREVVLDTLTIDPSSIIVQRSGRLMPAAHFALSNRVLTFANDSIFQIYKGDTLRIAYRVLPVDLERRVAHLDTSQMQRKQTAIYIGHDYSPYQSKQEAEQIFSDGLDYDGSFARGISFGNSQSLVLNSNFNLQITGDLGNDLKVQAAISDENIPIQPEGNTQLIQEFDQVFIKISKREHHLVAGDYALRNPDGYFMRYFKKVKGLQAMSTIDLNQNTSVRTSANFAISRGKFARNQLNVQEGNQGPYKLRGNNGEIFFVVLAGTEKVYVDGQLLERGLEQDYVIDYNLAEITFTAKQLITKDKRVLIDFEYSDQNFNRTQYGLHSTLKGKRHELRIALYSEQDSKKSTSNIDLDSTDIAILEMSGDNPNLAVRNGIRLITETDDISERVLYRLVGDTLIYTADRDSADAFAFFSDVGFGNGRYDIDNQAGANGRVYRFVGEQAGRFEPIIRLIPPEQRQMATIGGTYAFSERTSVSAEVALTNLDRNRFSTLQNDDNSGLAANVGFNQVLDIGQNKQWQLRSSGQYEFVHQHFNPLNPYRSAEFGRDWNIVDSLQNHEHLGRVTFELSRSDLGRLSYSYGNFSRTSVYRGNRHDYTLDFQRGGLDVFVGGSLLLTNGFGEETTFFRPRFDVSQALPFLDQWRLGVLFERERNERTPTDMTDLSAGSFSFDYIKAYLENTDNDKFRFRFSVNRRTDDAPSNGVLAQATTANELEWSGYWKSGQYSRLNWDFAVRDLVVNDAQLTNEVDRLTLLGKLDFTFRALQNAIRSTTSYNLSSGQEAKLEFTFQEVQEGRGDFIWTDRDSNGIQTLDEFDPAPFADVANFIRVRIFNNAFIVTDNNGLNQSLRFEPKFLWSKADHEWKSWQKWLARLSLLSNIRISQKTQDEGDNGFSPFRFDIGDTSLVSFTSAFNNTLFFNKGNARFDAQFNVRNTRNKVQQVTGFESNGLDEYNVRARFNARRDVDLFARAKTGKRILDSELFDQNDYRIDFWGIQPEVQWRTSRRFRLTATYAFDHKTNALGDERATSHDITFQTTLRQASRTSLNTSITFARVSYNGAPNTNLELAMLEGLKRGQNFLWDVNYTKRLANNLDLTLHYEGRKTGTARTVHVARAQIKATF